MWKRKTKIESVPYAAHEGKFLMTQRFKRKIVKPNTRKKYVQIPLLPGNIH